MWRTSPRPPVPVTALSLPKVHHPIRIRYPHLSSSIRPSSSIIQTTTIMKKKQEQKKKQQRGKKRIKETNARKAKRKVPSGRPSRRGAVVCARTAPYQKKIQQMSGISSTGPPPNSPHGLLLSSTSVALLLLAVRTLLLRRKRRRTEGKKMNGKQAYLHHNHSCLLSLLHRTLLLPLPRFIRIVILFIAVVVGENRSALPFLPLVGFQQLPCLRLHLFLD